VTTPPTTDDLLKTQLIAAFCTSADRRAAGVNELAGQLLCAWQMDLDEEQRRLLTLVKGIGTRTLSFAAAGRELGLSRAAAEARPKKANLMLLAIAERPDDLRGLNWRVREMLRKAGIFRLPNRTDEPDGRFIKEQTTLLVEANPGFGAAAAEAFNAWHLARAAELLELIASGKLETKALDIVDTRLLSEFIHPDFLFLYAVQDKLRYKGHDDHRMQSMRLALELRRQREVAIEATAEA
jgi:hypothetical protein